MAIKIIFGVLLLIFIVASLTKNKPYTDKEWDLQLKKDFKKYGPVPEQCKKCNHNLDEVDIAFNMCYMCGEPIKA